MDVAELRKMVCKHTKLADLLQEGGTVLRTPDKEEQVSCPFHGADASPSARHYPETNSMYCFTCKKSWDPISYLMQKRDVRFKEAVNFLAKKFSIDISAFRMGAFKERKRVLIAPKQKQVIPLKEKLAMAVGSLEEGIRSCRGSAPIEKYTVMVYLLSRLKVIEDWESFKGPATSILKQIRKYSMEMD